MIFVFVCVDIVSVGVSLITNNTIVGAAGFHVHLAMRMMNNSRLRYYDPYLMDAYFFIITQQGYILMHPMLPTMSRSDILPTMIHLRFLEREAFRSGIIRNMTGYDLYYCVLCGIYYPAYLGKVWIVYHCVVLSVLPNMVRRHIYCL